MRQPLRENSTTHRRKLVSAEHYFRVIGVEVGRTCLDGTRPHNRAICYHTRFAVLKRETTARMRITFQLNLKSIVLLNEQLTNPSAVPIGQRRGDTALRCI